MGWQHYCLIFRLKSPLHIGYRKIGNLMQTRPYVPGRVLWGALTARLVCDYDDGTKGQRYKEVGEAVKENFCFGYLWPAIPKGSKPIEKKKSPSLDDLEVRFPWDDKVPPFDYLFLDAYASTALEYDHHVAGEGTLHHVEFIRPYTRATFREEAKPVYLVGDIFVKEKFSREKDILKNWQEVFRNIQLGGERTYGWGKVELLNCTLESLLEKQGFKIEKKDEIIIKTENENKVLLAHVIGSQLDLEGQIEVLTAYYTDPAEGKFKLLEKPPVAYIPGTKIKSDEATFLMCQDPPGLWKVQEV